MISPTKEIKNVSDLLGCTLEDVRQVKDEIIFYLSDSKYALYYEPD